MDDEGSPTDESKPEDEWNMLPGRTPISDFAKGIQKFKYPADVDMPPANEQEIVYRACKKKREEELGPVTIDPDNQFQHGTFADVDVQEMHVDETGEVYGIQLGPKDGWNAHKYLKEINEDFQ